MKGTALSVCIHITAKLKQQETGREEKGNERLGSAGSAERLLKRLFDVNQQPSALMVASSTRLRALMQGLPHQLMLLSQPAL